MKSKRLIPYIPKHLILFTLPILGILGGALLALPVCQIEPVSLLDSIFTAISAICVNGLLTVPLSKFSLLGQLVIFFMMQLGGLGIITITMLVIASFVRTGLSTQVVAGQILEIERARDIRQVLKIITLTTLLVEFLGTGCIFLLTRQLYSPAKALFYAAFHAVSAFCNAGFTLFEDGLQTYQAFLPALGCIGVLIFIGSVGFVTWHELLSSFRMRKKNISLHSKLALSTITALVAITAILFFILEYNNVFEHMTWLQKISNALFNAVAIRGSGLLSIDIASLQPATILMVMLSAFIGAAPGSTGGGIKTATLTIFLAATWSALTGKETVELKGRRIPRSQVFKAFTILTLSFSWIVATTFVLLITEQGHGFLEIIFEANSAFSMFGVSLGLTPYLSDLGKFFIMTSMVVGRIGSLTLAFVFIKKRDLHEMSYPEERVMLS